MNRNGSLNLVCPFFKCEISEIEAGGGGGVGQTDIWCEGNKIVEYKIHRHGF